MGPAPEEDTVMSPPSSNLLSSSSLASHSHQEMSEKHGSLKRRFHELEKGNGPDPSDSTERNVRRREELDQLREEMREIEQRLTSNNSAELETAGAQPMMPRTILDSKARAAFEENLRQTITDGDRNNDIDPTPGSRHIDSETQRHNRERRSSDANGGRRVSLGKANTSPRLHAPRSPSATSIEYNATSLEMTKGVGPKYSYSRHSATKSVDGKQSPTRLTQGVATRRSQRNVGNNGSAIAAVAAAAAEAEAAAAAIAQTSSQDSTTTNGVATSQNSSDSSASTQHSPPTSATSSQNTSNSGALSAYSLFSQSPAMESIVKVAEAAIAAQNAAKLAASQSDSNMDPNLDPSLYSESNTPSSSTPASTSATPKPDSLITASEASKHPNKPPSLNTTTSSNATASSSTVTPTSTTSTSSNLSNNPYLALTGRGNPGSTTPNGHPMLMPYPLFYPTPGTPGTPQYPMAYNPYYYLAAPMGPNGMYPPPANFTPPQPQQQRPPPEPQRAAKPKRLKAHTVTTKSFSIPMVPRDKKGNPMLPLNVGIMTVISLGDVCMREHFHTERYIFPVGYEVTRRYLSTIDPSVEVVYHCTILDGGDGPKFQIIPADRSDKPVIAGTATGAWSNIVKQANAIRNRQHSNSVSGPDFFGLGQNTIKHLIQQLSNANRLRDYVWQNFVEGGPLGGRHAAVIPALPEEYDASMPIGAYYPRRSENPNPSLPKGLSYYPQHIIAQAEAQRAQNEVAAAQQMQAQGIAGPSGSGSSISAPVLASSGLQQQPNGHHPDGVSNGASLTIQEYQPLQQHHRSQSISAPGAEVQLQKRATRSSTAANTSTRHTRSASRGNQQQASALAPAPADGTTPMTFAGIMSAYPAPNAANVPAIVAPNTAGAG